MDDDPAQRPPSDGSPPPNEDRADGATGRVGPPESSSERSDPAPFWNITKASFAVQVVVGVFTVIGVAAGIVIPLALSTGSTARSTNPSLAAGSTTTSGQASPKRYVSPEATCDEYIDAAAGDEGKRLLVGSPGQLAGGDAVELRLLPVGEYTRVANAVPGDVFNVSTQISNTEYGSLAPVSVRASVSSDRGRCWRIIVSAKEPTAGETEWEPVLILLQQGAPTKLEYVPGSTELEEESGRVLGGGLPDGVVGSWIQLPYEIPGGTTYYLDFKVRIGRSQNDLDRTS